MTNNEKEYLVENAVKNLVEVIKESGEPVPPQVRHALSAVNGKATINGKTEKVGIDRAISLIRRYAPDAFDIQIQITKK